MLDEYICHTYFCIDRRWIVVLAAPKKTPDADKSPRLIRSVGGSGPALSMPEALHQLGRRMTSSSCDASMQ